MKKLSTILLTALVYFVGTAAAAPDAAPESRRTLAVYLTGVMAENERTALRNEIFNGLVKSGQYSAAGRAGDYLAAIAAQKGRVSDSLLMVLANRYGVEFVCRAEVTDIFGTRQISTRVINVKEREVEAVSKEYSKYNSLDEFRRITGSVVPSMVNEARARGAAATASQDAIAGGGAPAAPLPPAFVPAQLLDVPELGSAEFYHTRGQSNFEGKDTEKAISDYTEALRLDPHLVAALISRAVAHAAMGDYQSALADYEKSLELEPNDAGVFNSRAETYRKMGNTELALADYQRSLEIEPNDAGVFTSRAEMHEQMGNTELAIADYNSALTINPNNALALHRRANLYRQIGNMDLAAADYKLVLIINPGNKEAKESLSLIRLEKGEEVEEEEAEEGGADLIGLEPKEPEPKPEPKQRKPRPATKIRYGGTVAGTYVQLDGTYPGNSYGYLAGAVLSLPLASHVLTFETGANYHAKTIAGGLRSAREKWNDIRTSINMTIDESVVEIPAMLKLNLFIVPSFGIYLESGAQCDIILKSTIKIEDSEPANISDRESITFGPGVGFGFAINAGAIWYLGVRTIVGLDNFAGKGGEHFNWYAGLTVLY